jgi:hypothetical protein
MPRITHFTFPELRLAARDAHKLRGYFGGIFQQHSPLLHNHLEGGELRYAYPLVQYKVIEGVPVLVGIGEGATLLVELFMQVQELVIGGEVIPLLQKDLRCEEAEAGYGEALLSYRFKTLYFPLNQDNYAGWLRENEEERRRHLDALLRNHILAAFKGMGVWLAPEQRIMVQSRLTQKSTQFKNQTMLAFSGGFTTNAILPRWVGVGKSVSRGFGAVEISTSL